MKELNISVVNNIATYQGEAVVCGNENYAARFTFDENWEGLEKVARFIWNNKFVDVPLVDDVCEMPPFTNTTAVVVGVYVDGDDDRATTRTIIPCVPSILCGSAAPVPVEVKELEWQTVKEIATPFYIHGSTEDETYEGTYNFPADGEPFNIVINDLNYEHPVLVRAVFIHPFAVSDEVNSDGTLGIFTREEGGYGLATAADYSPLVDFRGKENIFVVNHAPKAEITLSFVAACGVTDAAALEGNPAKIVLQVAMIDGEPYDPTV